MNKIYVQNQEQVQTPTQVSTYIFEYSDLRFLIYKIPVLFTYLIKILWNLSLLSALQDFI